MKYAICILSSHSASNTFYSAFRFTKTLLEENHSISGIFFYHESVAISSSFICPPQDEPNIQDAWLQLFSQYNITPTICIAAALKRGIIDERESARYNKAGFNIQPPFQLGGLGELISACAEADRVITFGG